MTESVAALVSSSPCGCIRKHCRVNAALTVARVMANSYPFSNADAVGTGRRHVTHGDGASNPCLARYPWSVRWGATDQRTRSFLVGRLE